jgi:hypothetical protein
LNYHCALSKHANLNQITAVHAAGSANRLLNKSLLENENTLEAKMITAR